MCSFNPKWQFICSSVHSIHKDNPCQLPTISQIHVYQSPYLIYHHPSVAHTSVISLDHLAVCPLRLSVISSLRLCLPRILHVEETGKHKLWGEQLSSLQTKSRVV